MTARLQPQQCPEVGIRYRDIMVERCGRSHQHELHELLIFYAGAIDYRIGETRYRLRRGDVLALRPDECHRYEPREPTRYQRLTLRFRADELQALAQPHAAPLAAFAPRPAGIGNRIPFNNRETNRLLAMLAEAQQMKTPLQRLQLLLATLHLAEEALARHGGSSGERAAVSPVVARMLEYVEVGLATEDLRLETVAAVHGLSPTYVSRIFHEEVGRPFRDYVLYRRMGLAKHLLRQGASVSEACFGAGFNDYPNFIRRFRQRVGCSPGEFAKQQG